MVLSRYLLSARTSLPSWSSGFTILERLTGPYTLSKQAWPINPPTPVPASCSGQLPQINGCHWLPVGGVGEGGIIQGLHYSSPGSVPPVSWLTYQLLRSDMSISTVASVGEHNLTSDRCNVDWQNHSHVPRTCHVSCLHSQLREHHLLPVFPYVTYS